MAKIAISVVEVYRNEDLIDELLDFLLDMDYTTAVSINTVNQVWCATITIKEHVEAYAAIISLKFGVDIKILEG